MKKSAAPKSIEAATALLERYAVLAGEVSLIEAVRASELAAAGAKADTAAQPLLDEQATIAAQLELWWAANAASLTKGERRSMTIGGCKIGTKQGNTSLALAGDLDTRLPWWRSLDDVRQRVLLNMCFNLGIGRLLGFKNTLAAVQARRFADAASGMKASAWHDQVGARAKRLEAMMATGRA